jgi:hypothetical protein
MVFSIQIIKLSFLSFLCFRFGDDGVWDECSSSSIVTMFELFKIFIAHEEVEQGAELGHLDAR